MRALDLDTNSRSYYLYLISKHFQKLDIENQLSLPDAPFIQV